MHSDSLMTTSPNWRRCRNIARSDSFCFPIRKPDVSGSSPWWSRFIKLSRPTQKLPPSGPKFALALQPLFLQKYLKTCTVFKPVSLKQTIYFFFFYWRQLNGQTKPTKPCSINAILFWAFFSQNLARLFDCRRRSLIPKGIFFFLENLTFFSQISLYNTITMTRLAILLTFYSIVGE